jgi:hypothetical protein
MLFLSDVDAAVVAVAGCRLRFSVAFWHTFKGDGGDPFGSATKQWPWDKEKDPLQVRVTFTGCLFMILAVDSRRRSPFLIWDKEKDPLQVCGNIRWLFVYDTSC